MTVVDSLDLVLLREQFRPDGGDEHPVMLVTVPLDLGTVTAEEFQFTQACGTGRLKQLDVERLSF